MISHKHNKAEWPMPTGLSSLAPDPGPMALCNRPQSPNLPISTPQTMRDRHTNESHMAMEGHHWQACRLSPTYAAASTMTGDTSITHHVGPRLQQGWPVSRPPLPVLLQSRGGGMSMVCHPPRHTRTHAMSDMHSAPASTSLHVAPCLRRRGQR